MKNKKFNKKFGNKNNNRKSFNKKSFDRSNDRPKFQRLDDAKELSFENINLDLLKDKVKVKGTIERVVQTKGPTIFIVSDGTGSLALKGFQKPGERAFPEIDIGDNIKSIIEISEFDGQLEGEIKNISKLTDEESKILSEDRDWMGGVSVK